MHRGESRNGRFWHEGRSFDRDGFYLTWLGGNYSSVKLQHAKSFKLVYLVHVIV